MTEQAGAYKLDDVVEGRPASIWEQGYVVSVRRNGQVVEVYFPRLGKHGQYRPSELRLVKRIR